MRLGIDGYFMCGKRTGMGVMLENVLKNWKNDAFEETVLFVPEKVNSAISTAFQEKCITVCALKHRSFPVWEQFIVPYEARKHGLDCLWFPFNTGSLFWNKKMMLTIHDMLFMNGSIWQQPSFYKRFGQLYRKTVVPLAAKRADGIITVSEVSKKDILSFCPSVKEKIKVVYSAYQCEDQELTETQWLQFCEAHGISGSYILAYGSIDQRKNTMRVVQAYEKLCADGIREQLVLFGFKEWDQSEAKDYIGKSPQKERIHVLGYVSEEEKTTLFRHASVFLFPSLAEGFGIPVLEAYHYGTPLVTSNVTSVPEIAGDAAVYVDPTDIDEIAEGVKQALNPKVAAELIPKGYERAAWFTWERTAKQTIDVLSHSLPQ